VTPDEQFYRDTENIAFPKLDDQRGISPGSGYALWKEANGNSTSSF
jgi:hypothetical protein